MIVNLEELQRALRPQVSLVTLRKVIAENADFPVEQRGSNGIAYQFDLETCAAWWRAHHETKAAAIDGRNEQLALEIERIYGPAEFPGEGDGQVLSLEARKKAAEVAYLEDRNRRIRGDLVERAPLESALAVAVTLLRNRFLQIPAEFAKRRGGLTREEIEILNDMVERRLNGFGSELAAALIRPANADIAAA